MINDRPPLWLERDILAMSSSSASTVPLKFSISPLSAAIAIKDNLPLLLSAFKRLAASPARRVCPFELVKRISSAAKEDTSILPFVPEKLMI
jgi:hypothetical protein